MRGIKCDIMEINPEFEHSFTSKAVDKKMTNTNKNFFGCTIKIKINK